MLKKGIILSWLFLAFTAGVASAYRPFGTEDAGVAGKGVAQTEVSWDYLKWDNDELKDENVFLLVPIYGLTEDIELSAEIQYLYHNPDEGSSEDGVGDVNIVAKYLLLPESGGHPALAVKGVVKLDNGDEDKGLGSGEKDYSVYAVASQTVGELTGHLHIGYIWVGGDKDETIYGVALDHAMSEQFHVVAEITGSRHPDRKEKENPLTALAGLTYKISDSLTLDAAYRWGLNDASPDWSTTVGASITY